MVKELQYVSIKRVLDNLTEHPMLSDLTLEQVVRHTVRFIGVHGHSKLYVDKVEEVAINDFRGLLPCDLVSIIQVKDSKTGICLRAITDNFYHGYRDDVEYAKAQRFGSTEKYDPRKKELKEKRHQVHKMEEIEDKQAYKHSHDSRRWYLSHALRYSSEPAFKTQGRVIFTSFPCGIVKVAYKSIPTDEEGYPMLLNNENYLACLEAYIKMKVFTVKFDTGKISAGVLQQAQQDYAWLAGELKAEMTMPSVSEMESITRALNTLVPQVHHFDNGFRNLGDREYLRRQ